MKPESDTPQPSPRELLEERVIALLLGELSDNDAAEIEALMQADASLKAFHDEMLETIDVVGEAHHVAEVKIEDVLGATLKLNEERRAALMEVIGEEATEAGERAVTERRMHPQPEPRRHWYSLTVMELAATVAILGILAAMLLPALGKAKRTTKMGMLASEAEPASDVSEMQLSSEALGEDAEVEALEGAIRTGDELVAASENEGERFSFTVHASSAPSGYITTPATQSPQSHTVQLQTVDDGAAPNVRFSPVTPQQKLFLPGQGQGGTPQSSSRDFATGDLGGDVEQKYLVSNLRGGIRANNELRLAEKAEGRVRRRQPAAPGGSAGASGLGLLRDSEPQPVDALSSSLSVADKQRELRRKSEVADSGAVAVDRIGGPVGEATVTLRDDSNLLDAFGTPIGGLAADTMDRSRMDAAFEKATKGTALAALGDSQRNVGATSGLKSSGIAAPPRVPPAGDGFFAGRSGAQQRGGAKAQFGWAMRPEEAAAEARDPAPRAMFDAPVAMEAESRGIVKQQRIGQLAAAKLPALTEQLETDAKSSQTASFDSGVKAAKAKRKLGREVAREVPPTTPQPSASPVIVAGMMDLSDQISGGGQSADFSSPEPTELPAFAGMVRGRMSGLGGAQESGATAAADAVGQMTGVSVADAARKGGAVVVSGLNDQYDFAKANQGIVAGKPVQIMNEELGQQLQEQISREAMTVNPDDTDILLNAPVSAGIRVLSEPASDLAVQLVSPSGKDVLLAENKGYVGNSGFGFQAPGRDLAEVERLGRRSESKAIAENFSRAAVRPMFKQPADKSETLAKRVKKLDDSESPLEAKEAQVGQQVAKMGKALGGGMGGGGGFGGAGASVGQNEKWRRLPEDFSKFQDSMFEAGGVKGTVTSDRAAGITLEGEFLNAGTTVAPTSGFSSTLITTILRSGGVTKDGDLSRVQVLRKGVGIETVNVEAILEGTGLNSDVALEPGDRLIIPKAAKEDSAPAKKPAQSKPNPEIQTKDNAFSTFSLNVSDVSFKLAAASLEKGQLPEPATVRSEEFVNALNYRDPAPTGGEKLSFAWERAGDPFQHNRDLIRFSIQTAEVGRESGRPLNIVVLLDNSGSMERADRMAIVRRALLTLAEQMTPNDRISIVAFARTPRLWVNGMKGGNPEQLVARVMNLIPQGGTNLEAALDLGYEVAQSHFRPDGNNRVILLTDGAANLGDVEPERLKAKTEAQRKKGIALDCFGIGWEGLNDAMLESLTRNADGRYGFLNTEREAREDFAEQLAGALQVAASNVKAQVEFNPRRVVSFRQIGYEKHQLKKEQFRDNTVDAAEIGAAESGTALYSIQVNHLGQGPLGVARIRFLNPGTGVYEELEWPLPYRKDAPALADAGPSMRLAGAAAAFAEWLAKSPYAGGVTPVELQNLLSGVPESYPNDERPKQLEAMIRQARQTAGAAGGP